MWEKAKLLLSEKNIDIKNCTYCIATFLLCVIMVIIFSAKVTAVEDVIVNLFSHICTIGPLYGIEQMNEADNEFAAMAAFLIPTIQGIQIVTVVDKITEHNGIYNKILLWCGTFFLELFFGFTMETYQENRLIYVFMALMAGVLIYSFVLVLQRTRNIILIFPLLFVKFCFTNPVSRYLWAYAVGLFVPLFGMALIMELLNKAGLMGLNYLLLFALTPIIVQAEAWLVKKCLKLFFGDLYDPEEICTLDKIGIVMAGLGLVVWLLLIVL